MLSLISGRFIAQQIKGAVRKCLVIRLKIGVLYWHTDKTLLEKQYPKQYCNIQRNISGKIS